MHSYTRKLSIALICICGFLLITGSVAAQAVCPVMPAGTICLTQAEANVAAANARELIALRNEVAVLQKAKTDLQAQIAVIQATGSANVADLTAALHKTEIALAEKTGQLSATESMVNTLNTVVQFMLQHGRKKCNILSVCI